MADQFGTQKNLLFHDVKIAYYFLPNEGRDTLFFLHAAFADHEIFEAQIDFFSKKYQILLLDFPGHGKSEAKGTKATTGDIPDIMKMILDENSITGCHVIGVSLGSLIAQGFADRFAGMTKSVTIVGGYSIHKANKNVARAQGREIIRFALYLLFSMKKFRRYVMEQTPGGEHFREVFRRGTDRFKRRSFPAMSNMKLLFVNKDTPMTYPFFIVCGDYDQPLAQDAARELHSLEPDSKYAVIPDAGHCANIDNPGVFNTVLEDFLSGIDR